MFQISLYIINLSISLYLYMYHYLCKNIQWTNLSSAKYIFFFSNKFNDLVLLLKTIVKLSEMKSQCSIAYTILLSLFLKFVASRRVLISGSVQVQYIANGALLKCSPNDNANTTIFRTVIAARGIANASLHLNFTLKNTSWCNSSRETHISKLR